MDVDAAPREFCREPVRQNLHVAREHDDVGARLADQPPHVGFLLHFRFARHRQIVEGNALEIDMRIGLAPVVGDDSDRLHVEFADPPAIDEIDEAMVRFRDEDHHALLFGARPHLPDERKLLGYA